MPIFYTISRKNTGGLSEVHMRFYQGRGCDQRARTHIFVPISAWNAQEGRCLISRRYESRDNTIARQAQQQLDDLAARVLFAYTQTHTPPPPRGWLQSVIDQKNEELPLADTIDHYCDMRNNAPATRRKMHSLAAHLRAFETRTHTRLYAHTIARKDIEGFISYLREKGLGQNAVASRLRQFRALVFFNGRPTPDPFAEIKMPQEVYTDPYFLTADERDQIAACDALPLPLRTQRDIFIFQCYTGCRVSDLYNLTSANIKDGWLIYSPRKTERQAGRVVEIPLPDAALQLVHTYKGRDLRGRLFPFVSEVQYNSDIKEILAAACITRTVIWRDPATGQTYPRPLFSIATSHLARRTFTQIAYARTGNKRLVASLTGHDENSRAFNRYSGITREMKKQALGI